MDLTNLTKKNQKFIHIATNQLIQDGKSDDEIKAILEEVLPTIVENQKKGLTARALFGDLPFGLLHLLKKLQTRQLSKLPKMIILG